MLCNLLFLLCAFGHLATLRELFLIDPAMTLNGTSTARIKRVDAD